MRQFFKFFFASLAAIFAFFALIFILFAGIAMIGSAFSSDEPKVSSHSILHLDVSDAYMELPDENPFAPFSNDASGAASLYDVIQSIKAAGTDKKIDGIYMKLGASANSWASLYEIKEALNQFKESGKFIYAYGEVCDQKALYLSGEADSIFLNPMGSIEHKGLALIGQFFNGTLDKLDVKVIPFHKGQYKGAHEPFSRKDFSDANEQQLKDLVTDFDSLYMLSLSERSGKSLTELKEMENNLGIKFPADAVQNKFIHATLYADSVRSILMKRSRVKETGKLKFVSPEKYVQTIRKSKAKDRIAVLYAQGSIYDGKGEDGIYSETISKEIRKIADNDKVKALVLRVNSGGGSALASEVIYQELMKLKKKMPVYISMGNVAASGGYYISCAADKIYADPNTITGSIGVVGVMMNLEEFYKNKLGITFDAVKTADHADFPNVIRDMNDVEKQYIQTWLDSIYITFKQRVSKARNLSMDQVEELAQGHVYSGIRAKKIGLVDELAGMDRAIADIAKKEGLKEYRIVEYPVKEKGFFALFKSFTQGDKDVQILKQYLGEDYSLIRKTLELRKNKSFMQTVLPFDFEIK